MSFYEYLISLWAGKKLSTSARFLSLEQRKSFIVKFWWKVLLNHNWVMFSGRKTNARINHVYEKEHEE